MKKTVLLIMWTLAGMLGMGQAPKSIVVERVYASAGDAAEIFHPYGVRSADSLPYYHARIRLASPTDVYAIDLRRGPAMFRYMGYLVLDGQQLQKLKFKGPERIERKVQTLDLYLFALPKHPATNFYRDAAHFGMTPNDGFALPAIGPLSFLDENSNRLDIVYPFSLPGRVLASSVEEPATRYHPTFLFDGRDDFGWGTDHGQDGAGESLVLSFDQPLRLTKLKVWNGHQGSDRAFHLHPRVRTLLLSDGTHAPQRLSLPDTIGPALIQLPQAMKSATFHISIESVYPGQGSDVLALSEMQLGNEEYWFSLAPDRVGQHTTFVRAKTKGTALGDLLGQQLSVAINPTNAFNLQVAWVNWGDDGSFYALLGGQKLGHNIDYLELTGGWEHFLPVNGVSRVKVWGHRRVLHEKSDGVPSKAAYFEADIAIDAFQILPNALFDAIPTRLRSDDLVPCTQYVPVKEELVYRTEKNFMGRVLYSSCTPCLLRDTTARALARAQAALDARAPGRGLSFKIWDAYRPYEVQKAMWAHTPDTNYVANPYTGGSSHNKGLAIDLTIVDASGKVLDMGTEFDDFSKKAHHGYKRLPKDVLANRALLKAVMEDAGFVALPTEWWHYRLPLDLPIVDLKFPCPY